MSDLNSIPTAKSIAGYVRKNAAKVKQAQKMMSHGGAVSVRETDYRGHHIVVRTTYEVEVDGMPIMGHMGVTADGQVHYHPVPNIAYASALDLVKALIDIFPDDFAKKKPGRGGHQSSTPMSGMPMKKRRVSGSPRKHH